MCFSDNTEILKLDENNYVSPVKLFFLRNAWTYNIFERVFYSNIYMMWYEGHVKLTKMWNHFPEE